MTDSTNTPRVPGAPDNSNWIKTLITALGAGVMVVAMLAATNAGFGAVPALMSGLLLAGAATLGGAFLGFLFGIPRAKKGGDQVVDRDGNNRREYQENTNLEDISDWLTKIIVGLTLVQFHKIYDFIASVGTSYGPVFLSGKSAQATQAVTVALLLYFLITGFLFAYLWTRVYMEYVLKRQFAQSDLEIAALIKKQRRQESTSDEIALELTDRFLQPGTEATDEKALEVENAVAASSVIAQKLIFNQTAEVWKYNWRENAGGARLSEDGLAEVKPDLSLVDRTVPVFKGLTRANPEFHRYQGYLGYALVRSTTPDWAAAKAPLERAVATRGEDRRGEGFYDYNLALALINLDDNYLAGKTTEAGVKSRIVSLLKAAGRKVPAPEMRAEPTLNRWADLNGYTLE